MEVHDSARKHGIAPTDIAHAITHSLYAGDIAENVGPPWRVLYLGPDRAGNLLEVVAVERDDGTELVIHAMRMRKRYEPLLPRSQDTMMTEHRGTSGGVKLTREQLDALVEEADRGYDPDQLHTRSRRGRPPLGDEAATVFQVRLPPALRTALEQAADTEQTTPSDIVRRALRDYLINASEVTGGTPG